MESKNYNRDINTLEANAVLWWPESLTDKNANVSIIPNLLKSQTEFLSILNLSKESPFQIFDVLVASKFPVNLFLKHLSVLADYGGEPIQRLGRSFSDIFKQSDGTHKVFFSWEGENYEYEFEDSLTDDNTSLSLPTRSAIAIHSGSGLSPLALPLDSNCN